jgi:hypothetical protein
MSYEQGLKPLKQVQLSTLSPVMWSLKGGYPRKAMTVPIARESALGGYEDGLKPLNQVHLSRLSPVMWSLKGGYPRKPMTVPIGRGMGLDLASAGGGTLLLLAIPLAMFLGIAGIGMLSNVVNGRQPFGY